ncbi:MAG: hypothetical protein QM723_09155 [Myxococcaceae bacterium]
MKSNRGKEPTYVSELPGHLPLSIPNHPGDLKIGTARSILNTLEQDLEALELIAEAEVEAVKPGDAVDGDDDELSDVIADADAEQEEETTDEDE